jgi:hypothetical protein
MNNNQSDDKFGHDIKIDGKTDEDFMAILGGWIGQRGPEIDKFPNGLPPAVQGSDRGGGGPPGRPRKD